jgi:hypothetical protein
MALLSPEDVAGLEFLLKAPSKTVVVDIFKGAFTHRNDQVPDEVLASVAKTLNIQPLESIKLLQSVTILIKKALYEGSNEASQIAKLFPDNFHSDLKKLLSDLLAKNLHEWKTKALKNQVSLPRLIDFDWSVNIKSASDTVAGMAVPTCLVQMKVQSTPETTREMAEVQSVNVEFSKETLDTMLDGLSKIRDQLSSVAKSSS